MKTLFTLSSRACLIAVGMLLYSGASSAEEQKIDLGKNEYNAKCAICHGVNGKGSGPMSGYLRVTPSDLSQLARKNHGVLPTNRLFDVIDGNNVPSHGSRDMPIWGKEFRAEDAGYYKEARGNYDSQALVRARILALLEYIDRIQER
jgi:mono/diheme cytochrome c family protein